MNILTTVAPWAGITFTRATAATKQDGSSVASGVQRMEEGKYGNGLFIEEGATNLLYTGSGVVNLSQLPGLSNAAYTRTDLGGGRVRYTNTHTASNTLRLQMALANLTANTTYTFSIRFEERVGTFAADWCDGAMTVLADFSAGTSGRFVATATRSSYDSTYRFVDVTFPVGGSIVLSQDQVEARTYATSFIAGTRNAETCSVAASLLSAAAGTVEMWVNPLYTSTGGIQYLFSAGTWSAGKRIYAYRSATDVFFNIGESSQTMDKAATGGAVTIPNNAWSHLAFTWSAAAGMKFYVNGRLCKSLSGFTPYFDTSSVFTIGHQMTGIYQFNGVIDDLRFSNAARSDAEIWQRYSSWQLLDAATTGLLDFSATAGYLLKPDGNSVLLPTPLRDSTEQQELQQVVGSDSAGEQYVYDKGQYVWVTRSLVYGHITGYTLAALKTFVSATVRGSKTVFTGIDHLGVTHTVRSVAGVRSTPQTTDRHRAEISLEEQLPLPAPTAGTFSQMMARKGDVAPVWILKMTINSVVYYFSDSTFTVNVGTWSNITTKPWVSRWGGLREGITNGLNEIRVADIDVDLLIDPAASPNMETLATTYPLEKEPASLFLWFVGCTEAPREMFRGYVRDVDLPDDSVVSLMIEDEASRAASNYVGTQIDLATYPGADPDDVGKVIPVIYGSVSKLPALCVDAGWVTSLSADITPDQTTITVSEVPSTSVVNKTIRIDDESMTITAASGTSLTVDRAVNATPAQSHVKGGAVMEQKGTPLVYLVADHAVTSISKVLTRIQEVDVDITSDCTLYLGTSGNQHASYPGKACLTIGNLPAMAKKISLTLIELGHNHNSATSTTENTTLSLPTAMVYYGNYPQPSEYQYPPGLCMYKNVTFPNSGGARSSCSYSITINPTTTRSARVLIVISGVCKWWDDVSLVSGSPMTITFTANAGSEANADAFDIVQIGSGAGSYFNVTASSRQVYLSSVPSTYSFAGTSLSGNSVADMVVGSMVLVNASRTMDIPGVIEDVATRGGLSGAVTTVGDIPACFPTRKYDFVANPVTTYFSAINATLSLNANGMVFTRTAVNTYLYFSSAYAGSRFTKIRFKFRRTSGTSSWVGNVMWISNTHAVYDTTCVINIPQPADLSVWNEIELDMTTATGAADYLAGTINSLQFRFTSGQAADVIEFASIEIVRTNTENLLNGAITAYRPALEWLNLMAFQVRCWYRRDLGVSRLIVRPATATSSRTIAACAVTDDGRLKYRRRKVEKSDIINTINLKYSRDWSQPDGDNAYMGSYKPAPDTQSIADFGVQEQPGLFRFDFVTNSVQAQLTADFYQAKYKNRPWRHELQLYLDNSDLEFGDGVTLGFAPGDPVGTVIEVGHSPGSSRRIDKVVVTVEV